MPDFIANVYGKRYKITAPDKDQAATATLKLRQQFAQANPRAVGEYMQSVPQDQREVPSPEASRSPLGNRKASQGSAYGYGAADIGGFGFADEIGAGLMTGAGKLGLLPDKPNYADVLNEMRSLDAGAKEQHPNSYLTGQVGGGAAQAVLGGVPALLRGGTSLMGRMIAGGLTGMGLAGTHGAGSGTDTESRLKGAGVEGLIGAGVGVGLPAVGSLVSNGLGALRSALTMPSNAARSGYSPEALRTVGDIMDADQTLGQTGRDNIAAAGSNAMLVDAGPNARKILDTSIQKVGPGARNAREAVTQRTARASQDVSGALDTAFGQPQGVESVRQAIRTGTADARSSAYDAAYAAPIDYAAPNGQLLEQLVKTRVPQSAISAANKLMRAEGNQSQQILAKMGDDGSVVFERLPDVRQLDYITRGLNEVADQAHGKGKLGGTTDIGRAYEGLSNNIRQTLRTLVPEYGNALDTAGSAIGRSKAVKLGSQLLSSSMTRDEAAIAMEGMSKIEKQDLAQGIRSHADDIMANVTRTVQDGDVSAREAIKALKDFSSRSSREKVALAIGDQEAEKLFKSLDQAAKTFDLRAAVADNSGTYARNAAEAAVKARSAPGVIGTALEGHPINATQRLIQTFTGRTPEAVAKKEEGMWAEIADLLTTRPDLRPNILDSINRISTGDQGNRLMQDRILRGFTGGIAPSIPLAQKQRAKYLR